MKVCELGSGHENVKINMPKEWIYASILIPTWFKIRHGIGVIMKRNVFITIPCPNVPNPRHCVSRIKASRLCHTNTKTILCVLTFFIGKLFIGKPFVWSKPEFTKFTISFWSVKTLLTTSWTNYIPCLWLCR